MADEGVYRRQRSQPVYGVRMTDVFDRARAMSSVLQLWPDIPSTGSPFAADAALASVSTFSVARILVAEAVLRLKAGAEMAQDDELAALGSHLLLLRPTLVSTAKAAWLVRPQDSLERVRRALELVHEEQRQAASAMRKAIEVGAPKVFERVAVNLDRKRNALRTDVRDVLTAALSKPPRDEELIRELAGDVDRYYGTVDAPTDMQLLWNVSSSLSHGERWHSLLTGRRVEAEVAHTLTTRTLDAVCSGINVTSLRMVVLSATPPEPGRQGSEPSGLHWLPAAVRSDRPCRV